MINTDVLRGIYLFQHFTQQELGLIADLCEERQIIAGQDAFFSGQPANSFFVIRQGTIKIFSTGSNGDDMTIATLSSGSHFGEIPFLNGEVRTATAKATENTHVLEIPYERLRSCLQENVVVSEKFHKAVAVFLAKRLTITTGDLSGERESRLKTA